MPGKIIKIKASATQNHVPFHFAMELMQISMKVTF